MRTLIVGMGEVGTALAYVLEKSHEVFRADINLTPSVDNIEVLNICIPYTKAFLTDTKFWIDRYSPSLIINHSTVPIGTTRRFGEDAVHSPVIGVHPHLVRSLLAFRKPVGGVNLAKSMIAQQFLEDSGISTIRFSSPENTESAKLLSTLRYGLDIKFQKQVFGFCSEQDLDFNEVYSRWTKIYNEGYNILGLDRYCRPLLGNVPGRIGGHCIVPNARLLEGFEPANDLIEFDVSLGEKEKEDETEN